MADRLVNPVAAGLTAGGVLFPGAGGVLTQHATVVVDSATGYVGAGTATPTRIVHAVVEVSGVGTTLDTFIVGTAGSTYSGRKGRGTAAAPRRAKSGDVLSGIAGGGAEAVDDVTAATFGTGSGGQFRFFASEDFTATAHGAYFSLQTTPVGSTTLAERLRATAAGNITIGANPGEPSTGSETLVFPDGTAPSGMALNTAGLYANDVAGTVELFGIDEAGNSAQLTPHNFTCFDPEPTEPTPHAIYHRQAYLGVEMAVDMAKLARVLEALTGETLVYRRPIPARDWADDQETQMRRAIANHLIWETQRADALAMSVTDPTAEPFTEPRPALPRVKAPPTWLKDRLTAAGTLNTAKLTALRAELAAWRLARPA